MTMLSSMAVCLTRPPRGAQPAGPAFLQASFSHRSGVGKSIYLVAKYLSPASDRSEQHKRSVGLSFFARCGLPEE